MAWSVFLMLAGGQELSLVNGRHHVPVVIVLIHIPRQSDLFLVRLADCTGGGVFGLGQGWEQQRRQYGNNRDDHEQFNQGEAAWFSDGLGGRYPFFHGSV